MSASDISRKMENTYRKPRNLFNYSTVDTVSSEARSRNLLEIYVKAAVHRRYGSPEVVKCEEIAKPAAGDNQVLIKVRAASVNPLDWHGMRGQPYIMRMTGGLRAPKSIRLGCDVAGEVEAVGRNVTQFKPGDHVFGGGIGIGAFAEYACVPESALIMKPDSIKFEQAASVPVAGLSALQGLRDKAQIQPGQRVLINGAAGGVGTFAVQIAKSLGVDVTGVCSTRNMEMVRSLGADRVIDYTKEDFTKGGQHYDVILDSVGNRSLSACRRALNPKGICVIVTGPNGPWLGPLARFIQAFALSPFVSQKLVPLIAKVSKEDLVILRELILAGKITPVVDKSYRLSDAAKAIGYVEDGHARGKVVITVEHGNDA
jgi:NADPH:quinone reductase-like Zn-dependent oxidoreductase